jgi:hypothetical protein
MIDQHTKNFIDGLSISGTIAAILGALPAATAVLTFVWTVIRIYETKTVQDLIQRIREKFKHG